MSAKFSIKSKLQPHHNHHRDAQGYNFVVADAATNEENEEKDKDSGNAAVTSDPDNTAADSKDETKTEPAAKPEETSADTPPVDGDAAVPGPKDEDKPADADGSDEGAKKDESFFCRHECSKDNPDDCFEVRSVTRCSKQHDQCW